MAPTIDDSQVYDVRLGAEDIKAIQRLYGLKTKKPPTTPIPEAPRQTTRKPPIWDRILPSFIANEVLWLAVLVMIHIVTPSFRSLPPSPVFVTQYRPWWGWLVGPLLLVRTRSGRWGIVETWLGLNIMTFIQYGQDYPAIQILDSPGIMAYSSNSKVGYQIKLLNFNPGGYLSSKKCTT